MQEQVFFADPAMDRMFSVVVSLAAEVHVLRDRVHALEHVLQARNLVIASELEAAPPTPTADRDVFVRSIFEHLSKEPMIAAKAEEPEPFVAEEVAA